MLLYTTFLRTDTIMTTDTKRKFLIDIAFYSVIIAIVYFTLRFLSLYLLPFVIGIFVSLLVQKPVKALSQKFKIPKAPLTIFFVITSYLLIVFGLLLLIYLIYHWLSGIVDLLPSIIPDFLEIADNINSTFKNFLKGLPQSASDYIASLPSKLTDSATSFGISLSNKILDFIAVIPSYLISVIVTVVASCYIAYEYDKIIFLAKNKTPFKIWTLLAEIKNTFFKNIFKMLKGYALLMLLTFMELSIGLLLLNQKNAILLAAIICVVDILPILGTGAVLIPWSVVSLFTGSIWKAIGLICMYIAITIIRNFAEPKIIGNQVGLHPLLTLLAMFCGLKLLGIIGLFIFPITLIVVNDLYKRGKIKFNFLKATTDSDL